MKALIVIAAAVGLLLWLDQAGDPPTLLIDADYPRCVTVKNAPLLRSPGGKMDYRPGVAFNDRGNA